MNDDVLKVIYDITESLKENKVAATIGGEECFMLTKEEFEATLENLDKLIERLQEETEGVIYNPNILPENGFGETIYSGNSDPYEAMY